GRVRYPELRPQTGGKPVVLRVSATGHADYEKKDLVLKPGVDLDLGDIRMSARAVVSVSVVDDATGAPVENARVILATKSDEELKGLLDTAHEQDYWHDAKLAYGRTASDGSVKLTSMP